jgi:hypothetical protein
VRKYDRVGLVAHCGWCERNAVYFGAERVADGAETEAATLRIGTSPATP